MPNPTKRMTAQPARPISRYRPGKAVVEEQSSEEEDYEEEEQAQQAPPSRRHAPPSKVLPRPQVPLAHDESEEEDEDEEGFITEDEGEEEESIIPTVSQSRSAAPPFSTKPQPIHSNLPKQKSESSEKSPSEDEEDSSEEEEELESESSSDEEPQRKFQRPTFIKKSDRKPSSTSDHTQPRLNSATANSLASLEPDMTDATARRLAATDLLIADRIERDTLARLAGKTSWDDDDEYVALEDMVDDTDGVDPEAEYAAWKVRELKRLKRGRERIEAEEREREERIRRENLTAEEREREDAEFIARQREEKDLGRGQATYLARYHHKGAFFQDDATTEVLRKRDLMGARFEDEVDKERLPQYMQIRDLTKLGKKGRTRYKDLKSEDTGAFGRDVMRWRPGDGRAGFAAATPGIVDERFLPDRDGGGGRGSGPTGANASAVGPRRERRKDRVMSRSRSPRQDKSDRSTNADSQRLAGGAYSRSRSRSPPRRKRSPSPYHEGEKRRKVDAG